MSPTGSAVNGSARSGGWTPRRRAIAALAGLGALAVVPLSVHAATSPGALAKGDKLTPGKETPGAVTNALRGNGPVVVAFLLPGITEDEIVQKRLNNLRKEAKFRDTKFVIYRITRTTKLGNLPTLLDVKYTPAVAVVQGDDKLTAVWRGLVDEDIIAQSLIDARNAVPRPVKVDPPTGSPSGDPAGIALAKKVNAAYVKVPGVSVTAQGASGQMRVVDGVLRVGQATVESGGQKAQVILNATGRYVKAPGAACFVRSTKQKDVRDLYQPPVATKGVRFAKPVRSADGTTITLVGVGKAGQYGEGRNEYTVDAKTSLIVAAKSPAGQATYASLDKPPAIPRPDAIC